MRRARRTQGSFGSGVRRRLSRLLEELKTRHGDAGVEKWGVMMLASGEGDAGACQAVV